MQQQPLALIFEQTKHFVVGNANELAYQYLLVRNDWTSHICFLAGDEGSGKTALANEWRTKFAAVDIDLFNYPQAKLATHYYVIDDLPTLDCLHEPLFHLINAVKAQGAKLLLCSNHTPAHYPTILADLSSRLKAADFVEIGAPDDAMLKAIMQAHLATKQLKVEECVLDYLLKRINRSCKEAVEVLDALDNYSLKYNAEININMSRTVLVAF